jgi:histidine triad (HIT) family protein
LGGKITGDKAMSPKDFDANCLFCKIIAGQIPSEMVYKDQEVAAFKDIKPDAPVHIMVVPVKHIISLAAMAEKDAPVVGKMTAVANKIAREMEIADKGYRLIINSGPAAGQVIQHLHMHLLGGRELKWEH